MSVAYQLCGQCDARAHPPRSHCVRCGAPHPEVRESAGIGTVHAVTVVRTHPDSALRAQLPYAVAIVDLDEGVRLLARMTSANPLPDIGDQVVAVPSRPGDPPVFTPSVP